MKKIRIVIPGKPVAKPRPLKGKYGNLYIPKNAKHFENLVKFLASQYFTAPLKCPIYIRLKFYFPRPKNLIWKTKPMPEIPLDKKPDLSNCIKSIEDGLNGVAFIDDRQIWKIEAEKVYCSGGDVPKTVIEILWEEEDG